MKRNRSYLALSIALALHGAVFALLWITAHNIDEPLSVHREKRFGVLLSEEPELSEATESSFPQPSASAEHSPPVPKQDETPLPQPQNPSMSPSLRPITQAERDTLPRSVLHHYGDAFFELSAGEQRYIIDNFQRIRKINEIVGTRLLRDRSDEDIDPDDSNVVEFYLHPDGTVSDLHLQKNRIGTMLDELTLQTISLAHQRYPKPEQKTLVRIRVYIVVK